MTMPVPARNSSMVQVMIRFAAVLAAACAACGHAGAQAYPARTVKIVVPYTTGGGTDAVARAVAQALSQRWGQPVIVENVPGADGVIGAERVIRGPADGYTMMMGLSQILLYKATLPNLGFDVMTDLKLVSIIQHSPIVFAISPKIPARDMKQFAAYCRSPGVKCSWGSAGKYTLPIGRQTMDAAGIRDAVNVAYKGTGPIMTDVMGGHVTLGIVGAAAALPHHRAGTARVINVGSVARFHLLPDVPTLRESGLDVTADTWYGLMVPKDTPLAVIDAIASAVGALAKDPQLLAIIDKNGGQALFYDTETSAEYVRKEAAELNALISKYPPRKE